MFMLISCVCVGVSMVQLGSNEMGKLGICAIAAHTFEQMLA